MGPDAVIFFLFFLVLKFLFFTVENITMCGVFIFIYLIYFILFFYFLIIWNVEF